MTPLPSPPRSPSASPSASPPPPEDAREPTRDRTEEAARRAEARDRAGRADPEPSLARRFGQIGILGWIIVLPTLGGTVLGHWLDLRLGGGITLAAALLVIGAALGFWLALRWIRDQ
ncbi:MAG: AtpZ/AtpI family protein [Defluviimonas sp.]|uniref:AtpZ/AtpI family protein n=1 Tax=Albidovulum sp. TaxID=1872424 RepID=UPI002A2FF4B3|nr:AtpZ/AtpI family protein [Defluviimonas sp.]